MHKDINCPYCHHGQNIEHDGGFGFEEDRAHEMQCSNCDKYFVFYTSIHYYYEARQADCLNDGEHDWKAQICFPKEATQMQCTMCEDTRRPTETEMNEILKGPNNENKS